MSTPANQEDSGEMADLQRGLMELPQDQREALILVGAGGMSYEEAASICDCALGTMKSRVSRARAALEEIMDSGQFSQKRSEEHTSELQSLMRISYAVFCLKKKNHNEE